MTSIIQDEDNNKQHAVNMYQINHYINSYPMHVHKLFNRMNKERFVFYNFQGIIRINTPILNFPKKKLLPYNRDDSIVMDEFIHQLCSLPITDEMDKNFELARKSYMYSKHHCGKEQLFKVELDHNNEDELKFCQSLDPINIILKQVIYQFGGLNFHNGIIYNNFVNKKSTIKTLFKQNSSGDFDTEIILNQLNGNKIIIKPDISSIRKTLDNVHVKVQIIFTPVLFYSNGILHLKNEVLQINFFEVKKFTSKKFFKRKFKK